MLRCTRSWLCDAGPTRSTELSRVGCRKTKVDALAERLTSLADDVSIAPVFGHSQLEGLTDELDADLIVDCTVNTGVAVAIDDYQRAGRLRCPVVQLATDNDSATLGILSITSPDSRVTTDELDVQLRTAVVNESACAIPSLLGSRQSSWPHANPRLHDAHLPRFVSGRHGPCRRRSQRRWYGPHTARCVRVPVGGPTHTAQRSGTHPSNAGDVVPPLGGTDRAGHGQTSGDSTSVSALRPGPPGR